jgi:hypothetical protein
MGMVFVFIGLWLSLLIIIPIVFFLSIKFSRSRGAEKKELILKSIFATVGYIVLSALAGLMILLFFIGPHPESDRVYGFSEFISGIIIIIIYGFFGWTISCFIAGEIITFKKLISSKTSN